MPTTVKVKINQKEYLKKYLSGDKVKKKKKEKKQKNDATRKVKVIDDDLSYVDTGPKIDEELLLTGDDAPIIVGEYVEERGAEEKTSRWRSIDVKDEKDADGKVKVKQEDDMWGRKTGPWKKTDELSPMRKTKGDNKQLELAAKKLNGDIETTKQKTAHYTISAEERHRSSSHDRSPPRRRLKSASSNHSPIRRRRRDSDQSPPRKRQSSPIERNRRNHSHKSPTRRRRRSSDQSPPRRRRRSSDQSPPRRKRRDSDQYPPRKGQASPTSRKQCSSDLSPPRPRRSKSPMRIKREKHTPNRCSSPQWQQRKPETLSPSRRSRWGKRSVSVSPPPTHKPKSTKTLDGKKAGLQDAKSLREETEERRRREERLFTEMSSEVSGRDADVQVRSTRRRGKRARDAEAEDPETMRRKEAHEQKKQQLYDRWGKGLKQIEEHEMRRAEQEYEGSKPLARYSNDEDLDRHLRQQERADDPMLAYMREKAKERQKAANLPTVPLYEGSFPENRYGLRPGYRWDGVDRSNGYEKKWFDVQNEKRAVQDEAYKYSVEDM